MLYTAVMDEHSQQCGMRYEISLRRVQRVEAALKDCLKDTTSQLMWQKITGDSSGTCEGTLGTTVEHTCLLGR